MPTRARSRSRLLLGPANDEGIGTLDCQDRSGLKGRMLSIAADFNVRMHSVAAARGAARTMPSRRICAKRHNAAPTNARDRVRMVHGYGSAPTAVDVIALGMQR